MLKVRSYLEPKISNNVIASKCKFKKHKKERM